MANRWYFVKNGQRLGPFDFEQFRQMAASGMLQPTDMVSNDEGRTWGSADTVAGLLPGEPSSTEVSLTPADPTTANTPRTGRKWRSVCWVVSTHVLTTGFAMPAVASLLCLALLSAVSLAPLQWFLTLLAFQALGYIGGTFCSLSYIRKVALIDQPLACVKPSIITFVGLAVLGFAANGWTLTQPQQDSDLNKLVAIIGLVVVYVVVAIAFARITKQGFVQMENGRQEALASPVTEPLSDARPVPQSRPTPPLTLGQVWGGWTRQFWAVWLIAVDVAICYFCVYVWLGLDYTRVIWFPTMTLSLIVAVLAFVAAVFCTPVWFILDLLGMPAPLGASSRTEETAGRP